MPWQRLVRNAWPLPSVRLCYTLNQGRQESLLDQHRDDYKVGAVTQTMMNNCRVPGVGERWDCVLLYLYGDTILYISAAEDRQMNDCF